MVGMGVTEVLARTVRTDQTDQTAPADLAAVVVEEQVVSEVVAALEGLEDREEVEMEERLAAPQDRLSPLSSPSPFSTVHVLQLLRVLSVRISTSFWPKRWEGRSSITRRKRRDDFPSLRYTSMVISQTDGKHIQDDQDAE